jgi:hypothetical protein
MAIGHDLRLGGKELSEKVLKVNIVGKAAERSHCEMCVSVDESRHHDSATSVDCVIDS